MRRGGGERERQSKEVSEGRSKRRTWYIHKLYHIHRLRTLRCLFLMRCTLFFELQEKTIINHTYNIINQSRCMHAFFNELLSFHATLFGSVRILKITHLVR